MRDDYNDFLEANGIEDQRFMDLKLDNKEGEVQANVETNNKNLYEGDKILKLNKSLKPILQKKV